MEVTDFNSLKKLWYGKLARSGFEDIENSGGLKTWHSNKFIQDGRPERAGDTHEYLSLARDILHMHKFPNRRAKLIWELHCDGFSKREIAAILQQRSIKKPVKPSRVLQIIRQIQTETGLKRGT